MRISRLISLSFTFDLFNFSLTFALLSISFYPSLSHTIALSFQSSTSSSKGIPAVLMIPWSLAKYYYENNECWTTIDNTYIFWIIKGPITLSIIVSIFFTLKTLSVKSIRLLLLLANLNSM